MWLLFLISKEEDATIKDNKCSTYMHYADKSIHINRNTLNIIICKRQAAAKI